jgi:hypothetical protein
LATKEELSYIFGCLLLDYRYEGVGIFTEFSDGFVLVFQKRNGDWKIKKKKGQISLRMHSETTVDEDFHLVVTLYTQKGTKG